MTRINHLLVVVLLACTCIFAADIKITTVRHITGPEAASFNVPPWQVEVRYVHGTVQRQELSYYAESSQVPQVPTNPHIVFISHCDTGTSYEVDLDNHEYREFKIQYPSRHDIEQQVADNRKEAEKKKTSKTVDTGETRDFHGHNARHLITTIKSNPRYGSSEITVDGWYLDMAQPGCAPEWARRYLTQEGGIMPLVAVGGGMRPAPSSINLMANGLSLIPSGVGLAPDDLAIELKAVRRSVTLNGHGDPNESVTERRVIEYSEAALDPALFDVPPGFKKVKELHKHTKPTGELIE